VPAVGDFAEDNVVDDAVLGGGVLGLGAWPRESVIARENRRGWREYDLGRLPGPYADPAHRGMRPQPCRGMDPGLRRGDGGADALAPVTAGIGGGCCAVHMLLRGPLFHRGPPASPRPPPSPRPTCLTAAPPSPRSTCLTAAPQTSRRTNHPRHPGESRGPCALPHGHGRTRARSAKSLPPHRGAPPSPRPTCLSATPPFSAVHLPHRGPTGLAPSRPSSSPRRKPGSMRTSPRPRSDPRPQCQRPAASPRCTSFTAAHLPLRAPPLLRGPPASPRPHGPRAEPTILVTPAKAGVHAHFPAASHQRFCSPHRTPLWQSCIGSVAALQRGARGHRSRSRPTTGGAWPVREISAADRGPHPRRWESA
jgi:hypothetical protein